ncbi:hypothetical protein TARUN_5595 [Trichoderma arundinaceum]|uniref:Alpha/beta hydrolase fold-3 domain-containing protein n=1 Tax=Trichoderma arundinaceum TaxID=490622 RepID=A0A395NKL4_TRIAR|nr:hypothetical protein TARUN_5595 [Trichoderma arundinaceum]
MTSNGPPYDPDLALPSIAQDESGGNDQILDFSKLATHRAFADPMAAIEKEQALSDPLVKIEEVNIPGPRGDISLVIVQLKDDQTPTSTNRPAIFNIHGGGMVAGNAYSALTTIITWMKHINAAVIVSVSYRRAPENTGLALVEDCYEALVWFAKQNAEYKFDPDRVIITGISAGAGLAASVALKARDQGSPKIFAQVLLCPMLDDRNNTPSLQQYIGMPPYIAEVNDFGWRSVLGDRRGGDNVSIYEVAGRADNLSNLPPAYIDVGAAEPFRDHAVAYASKLWEHGVQAELHVWAGGFHGFDLFVPDAAVSKDAKEARLRWLQRLLR